MRKRISQFALFITGTLMIGYGAIRGEAATVLGKAIKLCLECVLHPEADGRTTARRAGQFLFLQCCLYLSHLQKQ